MALLLHELSQGFKRVINNVSDRCELNVAICLFPLTCNSLDCASEAFILTACAKTIAFPVLQLSFIFTLSMIIC